MSEPISASTRSPRSWPPRSLTALKSSQSSTRRLSGRRSAAAVVSSCSSRSPKPRRFSRPVRASVDAVRRSRTIASAASIEAAACAARRAAASARRRGKASAPAEPPTRTPTSIPFTRSGSQTSVRRPPESSASPASAVSTRSNTDDWSTCARSPATRSGARAAVTPSGTQDAAGAWPSSSARSTCAESSPRTCAMERTARSAIACASRRELMWTSRRASDERSSAGESRSAVSRPARREATGASRSPAPSGSAKGVSTLTTPTTSPSNRIGRTSSDTMPRRPAAT